MDEHGMTWWVARDLCRILDIDNVSDAMTRVRARDKANIVSTDVGGRPHRMLAVNESGLYRLIMLSRKKEAVAFQDWLVDDVLPTLRKTGRYIVAGHGQASGLSRSWEDFRQITPTQVRIFAWAWERPGRWFTTRELREQTQIHEVTARKYARYLSQMGVWEKLHRHPANLYQVDQQAARQQCSVLVTHLLAGRDLPSGAFPVLPTPAWQ
jgi:prophage antirepressor-like protein